jgi:hypothetical protein
VRLGIEIHRFCLVVIIEGQLDSTGRSVTRRAFYRTWLRSIGDDTMPSCNTLDHAGAPLTTLCARATTE